MAQLHARSNGDCYDVPSQTSPTVYTDSPRSQTNHLSEKSDTLGTEKNERKDRAEAMLLVLSDTDAAELEDLKLRLEAASYSEVVRWALRLYEQAWDNLKKPEPDHDLERDEGKPKLSYRVKVLVSQPTRQRLERLKKEQNVSYSEIMRRALDWLGDLENDEMATTFIASLK